jgi:hypothetical protein
MNKKKTEIKQIKIKILDFFKEGCVIFQNSKHTLCLSNGYYRCQLDCNHKCKEKNEGQFKKESFEKSFSRLANKFKLEKNEMEMIRKKMMRKYFMDVLIGVEEENEGKEEIVKANIAVMIEDFKKGKSIKKDANDTLDQLVKINKDEYPLILFSYINGIIATFSKPEEERWLGKALSSIAKHIYISDKGIIEKIELERWGWYILNLIDENISNYLWNLKDKGVIITNDLNDELVGKGIIEAIEYFKVKDFEEALNNYSANVLYKYFSIIKSLMNGIYKGDSVLLQKAMLEMMIKMTNDPIFQIAQEALPMGAKRVSLK